MTSVNEVLRIAAKEIGTIEFPWGSNRTKYGKWYEMDGQPWCAMFVSWVFDQAGSPLKITTDKGFAYCPYGVNHFKASGRWFTSDPQPGDIVFYKFGALPDHVGIVEKVGKTGILAIEGNTAVSNNTNGGSVMRRERSGSVILGYGRPAYAEAKTPPAPVNEEDDMPRPDDIVSEYRWGPNAYSPKGSVVRLLRDGSIRCYRAPFFGSISVIPTSNRLNWSPGDGVLFANDPDDHATGHKGDPRKGYEVRDFDDNMIAEFTPEWWAANKR